MTQLSTNATPDPKLLLASNSHAAHVSGRFSFLRSSAVMLCVLLIASSCRSEDPSHTQLSVYAASSLTDAFIEIKHAFEASRKDVDVSLNFAGSQVLSLQIIHGAPANLFASANPSNTQELIDKQLIRNTKEFANNKLAVIVPLKNPAGIESYDGLTAAERLVIGNESVPVGHYTREFLQLSTSHLGADFAPTVLSHVVSVENNARLIRARVELGEADAGIVYRTDAISSMHVRMIPIPAVVNVSATYTIGIVNPDSSRHLGINTPANQFIAFLLSPQGQTILHEHGFLAPE